MFPLGCQQRIGFFPENPASADFCSAGKPYACAIMAPVRRKCVVDAATEPVPTAPARESCALTPSVLAAHLARRVDGGVQIAGEFDGAEYRHVGSGLDVFLDAVNRRPWRLEDRGAQRLHRLVKLRRRQSRR